MGCVFRGIPLSQNNKRFSRRQLDTIFKIAFLEAMALSLILPSVTSTGEIPSCSTIPNTSPTVCASGAIKNRGINSPVTINSAGNPNTASVTYTPGIRDWIFVFAFSAGFGFSNTTSVFDTTGSIYTFVGRSQVVSAGGDNYGVDVWSTQYGSTSSTTITAQWFNGNCCSDVALYAIDYINILRVGAVQSANGTGTSNTATIQISHVWGWAISSTVLCGSGGGCNPQNLVGSFPINTRLEFNEQATHAFAGDTKDTGARGIGLTSLTDTWSGTGAGQTWANLTFELIPLLDAVAQVSKNTQMTTPISTTSTTNTTAFKMMLGITGVYSTFYTELVLLGNIAIRNNVKWDGCNVRIYRNNTNLLPGLLSDVFSGDTIVWRATSVFQQNSTTAITSLPVSQNDVVPAVNQLFAYYIAIQVVTGGTCQLLSRNVATSVIQFWDA